MKDYINKALRTLSNKFYKEKVNENIIHGAMGISTEANEILDAVKKSLFYGKDFDLVNLREEIGDCFWYLAILAHEADMSFEEIMEININKLKKRYPDKYTDEAAINRDVVAEYKVLKGE
jgi:NTP pyrophosphatase (non-canonical NTP hydrolase)